MSNFLIAVDLKPIFSTVPSIVSSIIITSPFLNLFSMRTRTPDIKFLKRSWAPKATATPSKPSPAIIGPTLIPHSSSTAQKPKIKTNIFKKLVIHSIKSLVRICSIVLTFENNGLIIWLKNQKVTIVKIETFIL